MSTDAQLVPSSPLPVGFWKSHRAMIGGVLAILIMLMMSACSDDEAEQHVDSEDDKQPQGDVVQRPVSKLPVQQMSQQYSEPPRLGYVYVLPPVQQPTIPEPADGNPWAVQTPPRDYGQYRSQQWGQQPQPRQPQYVQPRYVQPQQQQRQPSSGWQYRPLEPEQAVAAPQVQAPAVHQQPVQSYRPMAPYDRLSGSSFGAPGYPYGGAYPGYYGPGTYGAPGGGYAPHWPGASGMGRPGYW